MDLKFYRDIQSLLKQLATQPLTLKDILAQTSERGFSVMILLLTLPFLFPLPPGFPAVLGWGCFLLAVQMAMGRRKPWLPSKIAKFQFPQWFSRKLLINLKRLTKLLEKFVRPRLLSVAANPKIWRWNGICIAWLTVLLMLPIPFTNPIPTIGILLLAIATLEEDGLLMCISYGVMALITLFFGFIFYAIWLAPQLLPNLFQS